MFEFIECIKVGSYLVDATQKDVGKEVADAK